MSSNNPANFPSRREFLASSACLLLPTSGQFSQLVTRLSDPETGPAADNLISNEDSYPRVTSDLARQVPPSSVYIGVGPDQNFTYIAHARPRLAFILDYRRRNLLLHLLHKAIFTLADDRVRYLSLLTAREPGKTLPAHPSSEQLTAAFSEADFDKQRLEAATRQVAEQLRPLGLLHGDDWSALATIQAKLAGPGLNTRFLALTMYPTLAKLILTRASDQKPAHFLADDRLYQTIRDQQRADTVVPLVGDFVANGCLGRLALFLREAGHKVGALYVSDVEFFLLRSGKFPAYIANLERLPWSRDALIVRTSTREITHPGRARGDSATTIVRPVAPFLSRARQGRIRTVDDLFDDN